jgi:hypothetical protein
MKKLKTLICALVLGAIAFGATKADAFPLYLTSLSGTITYTPHYGTNADTTTKVARVATITLKTVRTIVTNQVAVNTGTNVPANARIAFDPFTFTTYLTNGSGYFYDLGAADILDVFIDDIATTFQATTNGGTESDVILLEFNARGLGPNGLFTQFRTFSRARLTLDANDTTQRATMKITGTGSDYGEFKNSDDGVATGTITFEGSGNPEWEGPYSVFWANF